MSQLLDAFSSPPISVTSKKVIAPPVVPPPDPIESRTVFVGNIEQNTKPKEIKKLFKQYGPIVSLRFRSIATNFTKLRKKASVILKDLSEVKDTMNAYIVFADAKSAEKSLSANSIVFKERHLRVDYADKQTKESDATEINKTTIFVGNLPFTAKEEEIWKFFSKCGDIEYVRVIRDNFTQQGKGIAYVKFKSKEGMANARKMTDTNYEGRVLRIKKSTSSVKLQKKEEKRENIVFEKVKERKLKALEKKLAMEPSKITRERIKKQISEVKEGNLDVTNNDKGPIRKDIRKPNFKTRGFRGNQRRYNKVKDYDY
jgi:nucleolar protein 12